MFQERFGDVLEHEDIVWRGTGLPSVEPRPWAMRRAATGKSADEWTIVGFFPPSSSTTGVRFLAAAVMTNLATVVPPVKKMWSHCCSSSAVVSGAAPRTTEKAPRSRYSGSLLAITSAVAAATSEGLMTAAFPPEIAAISGDNVSITG